MMGYPIPDFDLPLEKEILVRVLIEDYRLFKSILYNPNLSVIGIDSKLKKKLKLASYD